MSIADSEMFAQSGPCDPPAPSPHAFPRFPVSWHFFCRARELDRGPCSKRFLGTRIVVFRTSSGRVAAMQAACAHMGCDLGNGRVIGDALQCPFHQWRYGADGRCTHIPAQDQIPDSARQYVYPVEELHGYIFIFNGPEALFPLPFFPVADRHSIRPSAPFYHELHCPWYMIGANAYDFQHFRASHDRVLLGQPDIEVIHPFARRAAATFEVVGNTLRDTLTRRFAGERVTLSVTDWCGSLSFVTATFRRTTNYGMVAVEACEDGRTRVTITAFVQRSEGWFGRTFFDPVNAFVRRHFIRAFLIDDVANLEGISFRADNLLACDRELSRYFNWLAATSQGTPSDEYFTPISPLGAASSDGLDTVGRAV